MIYTSLIKLIHTHTHTHIHTHTHARTHMHTHTHMFPSIVVATPQGSVICFVFQNDELLIIAKSPIFQCVKSVGILSFSGLYFTTLGLNMWIY